MKKLIVMLLILLCAAGCQKKEPMKEITYRQINSEQAIQMMAENEGYVILDVRTPAEYHEGHIEGAINVPNEEINDKEISRLPDKDQLIFVYCRSGNRSKDASEKLVKLGYTNIVEFGGINTWPNELVK
ncbi:MAG: rhodanese-like domain-containing protein [Erysipelotrichaceae bacterium]|nr:rhodanese-like domain-containing protein [Erysipelotrichaceae bacterium]